MFSFSCKTNRNILQKDLYSSISKGNTLSITNCLNNILLPYSSFYDATKPEKGYMGMYKEFTAELLKTKCIKDVIFTEGIAKSLPPKKGFKIICLINDKTVSYLGVILLSEIPKIINLSQEEPLK